MTELNEYMSYFLNPLSAQNNRFVFNSMLNIISVTKKNVSWMSVENFVKSGWGKKKETKIKTFNIYSRLFLPLKQQTCAESSKQKTNVIKQTRGGKKIQFGDMCCIYKGNNQIQMEVFPGDTKKRWTNQEKAGKHL